MPELAQKCIESWRKYLPEYELRLWNEDSFDLDMYPYAREAYDNRKFAFVTDVVRLWALEKFGGVYMDTDVEVLKSFEPLMQDVAFIGLTLPREKLYERLAKLSGGVAVIRVGAATETEMKESKLRLEDALAATKAAVDEGIVCGGGSAYIHASKEVEKLVAELSGDERTGAEIILRALEAPLFHIAANAGLEGAVIINKVKESKVGTFCGLQEMEDISLQTLQKRNFRRFLEKL